MRESPVDKQTAQRPRIIGLCGRMGSGKDTVAGFLAPLGYRRLAFADALKDEVARALAWHTPPGDMPTVVAEALRQAWRTTGSNNFDYEVRRKPTHPDMRRLLQLWGTEYRRTQDPEYWVKQVGSVITSKPNDFFVITDVRFPNEAESLRRLGGTIWRVDRPGCELSAHVSELLIEEISPDLIIENSGDLHRLEESTVTAVIESVPVLA